MKKPMRLGVFLGLGALLLGAVAFATMGRLSPQRPLATKDAELVVFAAASLRDVFAEIAKKFQEEHPHTKVKFSFAGSQELAVQIEHGAAADVFATADTSHSDKLLSQGLVKSPSVFACNEPVLIVPTANPAGIKEFTDLPKASRVVLGVPAVPIGKYSEQILKKADTSAPTFSADVLGKVVSREMTVRHVLTKVALGEADAGIVYRTDALTSKQVKVVTIPAAFNVTARYPIAVVVKSKVSELAEQWRSYVTVGPGHALLEGSGFGCPK